jgi:hypothetical protein
MGIVERGKPFAMATIMFTIKILLKFSHTYYRKSLLIILILKSVNSKLKRLEKEQVESLYGELLKLQLFTHSKRVYVVAQ